MSNLRRYLPVLVISVGAAGLAFAVAVLRDIRLSDAGVQGAVVGGLAGVIGAVLGSAVGALNTRTADDRRWQHEERTRRRTQGEQRAPEVRNELLAAADLLSAGAGEERSKRLARTRGIRWERPDTADIQRHTQRAAEVAMYIPESRLRLFTNMTVKSLENWDDANDGGADEPWIMADLVKDEVNEIFGAYGRGDELPDTPYVIKLVAAIDSWWDDISQLEEEHREQERVRAEREGSGPKAQSTDPHKNPATD